MVYKKYIKRGDKVYGPYEYHSKRENGKVITEYHGKKNIFSVNKHFFWIIGGFFLLFFIFLFLVNSNFIFTGKASLQLDTDYRPNESLQGILRLSLNKGELIPSESKVIVEIGGEEYSYVLSDLVDAEEVEGNFYVKDSGIVGSGLGYGEKGAKEDAVDVNFKLEIIDEEKVKEEKVEASEESQETTSETNESIQEETPTEEIQNESEQEITIEEPTLPTQTGEVITQNSPTTEQPSEETNPEQTPTEIQTATQTETTPTSSESPSESSESSESTSEENTEQSSEQTKTAESPEAEITGGVIKTITGFIAKTINGLVSLDIIETEVVGSVSYGEVFEYKLPKGKTAKLKPESVVVKGEVIEDNYISITIKDEIVVVSTDYYKDGIDGFGEDYLENKKINFDIDLTSLNLTAKDGIMTIKIIYNDEMLAETSSQLSVSLEEFEALDIFDDIKFMNSSDYELTAEERAFLIEKTGTDIIRVKNAEVVNGRFVVKYSLGDYWMEFSYDYPGNITDTLKKRVEFERKLWLKTLATQLAKKPFTAEDSEYLKKSNFSLDEFVLSEDAETPTPESNENESMRQTINENKSAGEIVEEERNITKIEGIEQNYSI